MSLSHVLIILAVGLGAGTINAVVGSGSLITFPTLLALGYPALLANVTNTVGLVPGAMSAVVAYRGELEGQRGRLLRLGSVVLVGGIAGATLLLVLPPTAFRRIVPVLILLACVLVALQPRIARLLKARNEAREHGGVAHLAALFLTAVYGGYFGAAQGVMVIAILGIFIGGNVQRLNGIKNVLVGLQNGSAALVFICFSHVSWSTAGLIAAGSVLGGQLGGHIGRRIPPPVLRVVIIAVGLIAFFSLVA